MSITGTQANTEIVIKDKQGNVVLKLNADRFPLSLFVEGERLKEIIYTPKGRVTCV